MSGSTDRCIDPGVTENGTRNESCRIRAEIEGSS